MTQGIAIVLGQILDKLSALGCSITTGVRSASPQSKYMLCLDDDVILPPSALQNLVHRLESDPSAFMATGAPEFSGKFCQADAATCFQLTCMGCSSRRLSV